MNSVHVCINGVRALKCFPLNSVITDALYYSDIILFGVGSTEMFWFAEKRGTISSGELTFADSFRS